MLHLIWPLFDVLLRGTHSFEPIPLEKNLKPLHTCSREACSCTGTLYRYIFVVIGEELLFPKFLAARRVTLCLLQWQVDLQLRDVPFEGNNTKNANNMQEMGDVVGNLLEDAGTRAAIMKKCDVKLTPCLILVRLQTLSLRRLRSRRVIQLSQSITLFIVQMIRQWRWQVRPQCMS
jgi:hypothetical protein